MTATATTDDLEFYRRELTGYCYRMLGSAFEADDAVQETMLRAWKGADGFEGRASLRSWLYRIATNVCLTALAPRPVRMLPSGLAGPYDGPDRPPSPAAPDEVCWLEPLPDAWLAPPADEPQQLPGWGRQIAKGAVDEGGIDQSGEQAVADFLGRPGVPRPDEPRGDLAQQGLGVLGKRVAGAVEPGPAGVNVNERHDSPADDLGRLSHPPQLLDRLELDRQPNRADPRGRNGHVRHRLVGVQMREKTVVGC